MQHLLDFLYEHSLDKRLFCVLAAGDEDLQLTWHADDPLHWEVRHASAGPAERVPRSRLIADLDRRGAVLEAFEGELRAMVATHIVVADQLLSAAQDILGSDGVSAVLRGHDQFVHDLRRVLTSLLTPRLRLVR
ncbi:MAG: hypothetical protein ABW252_04705 [Polyangiales bacterium]